MRSLNKHLLRINEIGLRSQQTGVNNRVLLIKVLRTTHFNTGHRLF